MSAPASALSRDQLAYLKSQARAFGTISEADDFLHGPPADPHYSVTETIWFEVLVPKANLVAHFYIYMRPNLGICAAGGWFWRGFAATPFQMDHFNYQAALPMPVVSGNTVTAEPVGLSVEVLAPLKQLRIRYRPPGHDVSADILASAVMPPAIRASNRHFNQFMHYQGEIRLGAEAIPVDGVSIRDRSWHEQRVEDSMPAPITSWISGMTADRTVAFNLVGQDDPESNPEWAGVYPVTREKALFDGWYYANGELQRVIWMSKHSERVAENHMAPRAVHAEFLDMSGTRHEVHGRPVAASWMSNWPNIHVWLPLMEWEIDGVPATGDCQEYCWPDYARRFFR